MNKIKSVTAGGVAAALLLTACGSTAHPKNHTAADTTAAPATPSKAPLACNFVRADIATVVRDYKRSQRHEQEAWVSGGYGAALRMLIQDTDNANVAPGTNQLNDDAVTFHQDAAAYLSANSPYLAPGWESGYNNLTGDINALAADCGLPAA